MQAHYFLLDVFTDKKFGGNQLAVFPEASDIPEELLQKIARELNLSETVYLYPPETERGDFKMRIFTTAEELPTAGHPTIGTSHLLLNTLHKPLKQADTLVLEQKVGLINVTFEKTDAHYNGLTMQQPNPVFGKLIQNRALIAEILSIEEDDLMHGLPIQCISCGNDFMYIPVASLEVLSSIEVRGDLLKTHGGKFETQALYIFTTQTQSDEFTTQGRMFAPEWGITEDPATGSASGPLGCYLVRHSLSNGKKITCAQGVEMGRPSTIHVQIAHTQEVITKVLVGGEVVLVGEGRVYL